MGKYEGAGNDFLVVVDPHRESVLDGDVARLLCDRHTGVGADGLIRVSRPSDGSADLAMELWNADGGAAEMSGNGIRCLAQAAHDHGLVHGTEFTVSTAAGLRRVEFRPNASAGCSWASVDMGPVALGAEPDVPPDATRARLADVGNPHIVLLVADPHAIDLATRGSEIASAYPGGINVEFISADGDGGSSLEFRVWERGAGATLACGTGSVAAAAVAAAWGLVGSSVMVVNPGGPLEVVLGPEDEGGSSRPARLGGPVRKVADVDAVVRAGR
jgi:diaminopimelate epimerase